MTYSKQEIINILTDAAKAENVDPNLLIEMARQESKFDPNAVSPAGAKGLMQFMPATAVEYKISGNEFDPKKSAQAGAKKIKHLLNYYEGQGYNDNQSLSLALAAYNCGEGTLKNCGNDISKLKSDEPKNYVKIIRGKMSMGAAALGDYKNAADYAEDESEKSNAPSNKQAARLRKKIGKPQNKEQDEEDNYSYISDMMDENPIVGLVLFLFAMFSGGLDLDHMGELADKAKNINPAFKNLLSNDEQAQLYNIESLRALSRNMVANDGGGQAAELAERFLGQKEETGTRNCGAIVQLSGVPQGQPWCGGFAHFVLSQTMPNVYKGENFNSAASFMEYGKKYNAFHAGNSDYDIQKGDVIVLKREGGSGCHVGIVTGIDDKGNVTYIAGNDGNKVAQHTINKKSDDIRGFTSSHEIANARGIDISGKKSANMGVETSQLPENVKAAVAGLDLDNNGIITASEEDKYKKEKPTTDYKTLRSELSKNGVTMPDENESTSLYAALFSLVKKQSSQVAI